MHPEILMLCLEEKNRNEGKGKGKGMRMEMGNLHEKLCI